MAQKSRKRFYVDPAVQKGILVRFSVYWLATMLFVCLPLAFVRTLGGSGNTFFTDLVLVLQQYWPILVTLTIALPFVLTDVLKFSNRFAGPIFRLKRSLEEFEQFGEAAPLQFRDDDYWKDLADGFNRMQARIQDLENQKRSEEQQATCIPAKGKSGIVINEMGSVPGGEQLT